MKHLIPKFLVLFVLSSCFSVLFAQNDIVARSSEVLSNNYLGEQHQSFQKESPKVIYKTLLSKQKVSKQRAGSEMFTLTWDVPGHCSDMYVFAAPSADYQQSGVKLPANATINVIPVPEPGYIVEKVLYNGKDTEVVEGMIGRLWTFKLTEDTQITVVMKELESHVINYTQQLKDGEVGVYKYEKGDFVRVNPGEKVYTGTEIGVIVTPDLKTNVLAIKVNGQNLELKPVTDGGVEVLAYTEMGNEDLNFEVVISEPVKKVRKYAVTFNTPEHTEMYVYQGALKTPLKSGEEVREGRYVRFYLAPEAGYNIHKILINGEVTYPEPVKNTSLKLVEFKVSGETNVEFTVKEGLPKQYSVDYKNFYDDGVVAVVELLANNKERLIHPGDLVLPGSNLVFIMTPDPTASVKVAKFNGEPVTVEDAYDPEHKEAKQYFTVMPEKNVNFEVEFNPQTTKSPSFNLSFASSDIERGEVLVMDILTGVFLEDNVAYKSNRPLALLVFPRGDNVIKQILFNDTPKEFRVGEDGTCAIRFKLTEDTKISVLFDFMESAEQVSNSNDDVLIVSMDGLIRIDSQNTGAALHVFAMNGMCVYNGILDTTSKTIDVQPGVYVVRLGDKTYKVLVK